MRYLQLTSLLLPQLLVFFKDQLRSTNSPHQWKSSTRGGTSIDVLSRKIVEASGGAVDLASAFRQVSLASSAGLNTEEIEGLTMVAKGAAISLGRDLPDAMDRIFRGAIKLEPEILDEIGLFVRVDEAARTYAQGLGRTDSSYHKLIKDKRS